MTPSLENYLETIYNVAAAGNTVRVTDLASAMGIAKSSVHVAMHALKDMGLVVQEHYGQISLTHEGGLRAQAVRFRHNALLTFYTEALGIDRADAEEEACMIEHIVSDLTVERIVGLTERLRLEGAAREKPGG